MKYFLPIYILGYTFAAFFWRSYIVRKKTGVNPITFKNLDTAHDFVGRMFTLLFAMVLLVVLIYSFAGRAYEYTLPIAMLDHNWIRSAGLTLMLVSLGWTVIAQAQMGESWRIGIDADHRTALVQNGIFSISRNPIFLGMIVTLVGLFLVIPNAVTLLALVSGVFLIGVQVRLEEEHLMNVHPDQYPAYRRRVRRWF